MRIDLGNGQFIESMNKTIPSKRKVKNGGGNRKSWRSRTTGTNVGGTNDIARALYNNYEVDPDDPSVVIINRGGRASCITVDGSKKTYTWEVGGSCSTGYIGGKGA